MTDTWTPRDLPVLETVVELYEENGRGPIPSAIAARLRMDEENVQRALEALQQHFDGGPHSDNELVVVGRLASAAHRAVGSWQSPEAQLAESIAAFEAAADDSTQPIRGSVFKQTAHLPSGTEYQLAIGTLRSAGGNLVTG